LKQVGIPIAVGGARGKGGTGCAWKIRGTHWFTFLDAAEKEKGSAKVGGDRRKTRRTGVTKGFDEILDKAGRAICFVQWDCTGNFGERERGTLLS